MTPLLQQAWQEAIAAVRKNILPGWILQVLLMVFLAAYLWFPPMHSLLEEVAKLKSQSGYLFGFVSYALAAGLLPEVLRFVVFQRCRLRPGNGFDLWTACVLWGVMGVFVDIFYRFQIFLFGSEANFPTILKKVLVDQLLYAPFFAVPLSIFLFAWRDRRFRLSAVRSLLSAKFYLKHIFPVTFANWGIWVPAVTLIYFMPGLLQVPVASLIQAFWVLIFLALIETPRRFA